MAHAVAAAATGRLRHVDMRMPCDCTNGTTDAVSICDSASGIGSGLSPFTSNRFAPTRAPGKLRHSERSLESTGASIPVENTSNRGPTENDLLETPANPTFFLTNCPHARLSAAVCAHVVVVVARSAGPLKPSAECHTD